ncbi:MAG: helix-hairpin-helix domain-containing protein [Lachnospiraceae bacterium]|nr:helix-hairpin-helix domain-containing protein [Lachnospiraceae bacterium]
MKKYIRYIFTCVITIILGILYSCERQQNNVEVAYSVDETSDTIITMTTASEAVEKICVHVTGYVVNPGVYYVPEGSRVFEVIELAGGFLDTADKDYLNQAVILNDGQKLHIYSKEEAATANQSISDSGAEQNPNKLVNINTATKEELMTLPGIGESKAESIIAYRQENGGFKTIEDIMKISGIKDAAFSKIKNYICTN